MKRTWIEVSRSALIQNLSCFQKRLPQEKSVGAVVKSNAYGHGMELVASIWYSEGIRFFCVDSASEAKALAAQLPHASILVMGMMLEDEILHLPGNCRMALYNPEDIETLKRRKEPLRVHLKINTGLNRQGIEPEALEGFLQQCDHPNLIVEGIYSHLANVEDTLDESFYRYQWQRFSKLCSKLPRHWMRHISASAAGLLHPAQSFDLVRAGISLYGYHASWKTYLSLRERSVDLQLKKAMAVKTRVAQVRSVQAGEFVGYGLTHQFLQDSKIAVLPIGYADGYPRLAGQGGQVLIHGRRCPIVGRIAMNMMVVEVAHVPQVQRLDEVTLMGQNGRETIDADEIADRAQTIAYEILTCWHPALPRIEVQ